MKQTSLFTCLTFFVLFTFSSNAQEIGLNFNHNPENIDLKYVAQTGVKWVRTTPRILDYVDGALHVKNDPGIKMVVASGKSGYEIAFGFRWDFKRRALRLPEPNTDREALYFKTVDSILDQVGQYVKIFKLGNEPNLETMEVDMQYNSHHEIPLVIFTNRLFEHVFAYYKKHPEWKMPEFYTGSLPALFEKRWQENPGVLELIQYTQTNKQITGLAVHLHIADTADIPQALTFVRRIMPSKPIIVPEFSLWRLYNKQFNSYIKDSGTGAAFLKKYKLPKNMKVHEFLTLVNDKKIPPSQFYEMFISQNWYPDHYLNIYRRYYQTYGVTLATYPLFQQGYSKVVTPKSQSWFLNPIFMNKSYGTNKQGEYEKNPLSYEDFMNWVRNTY